MKKVVVAMSGGVDSSVACALIKERGFEPIGLTLKFFDSDLKISCCGANEAAKKAAEVCAILKVRHYSKDARKLFKKTVIDNFINSYASGKTPNPCIECNKFLKFDYLFKIADSLGADFLATGHYASIKKFKGKDALFRGLDKNKDQSYFLYPIEKEKLSKILFPLAETDKTQTRRIAKELSLPTEKEKESKDICFIPEGDYALWLKKNSQIKAGPGYIKDEKGKILGSHNGYFNFTIGQRRNLKISASERLYVNRIDPENNEVFVAEIEKAYFSGFIMESLNWLDEKPLSKKTYSFQIRYRQTPCEGTVEMANKDFIKVKFSKKQFAVTAGQSAVFYDGDRVLGGGKILKPIQEGEL